MRQNYMRRMNMKTTEEKKEIKVVIDLLPKEEVDTERLAAYRKAMEEKKK